MRIIISPAKKMRVDLDSFAPEQLPQFLSEAELLKAAMKTLSEADLQALWKCNDALTALNAARLRDMDLHCCLTPAILAYDGIQYRYMAPNVFLDAQLSYLRTHLRILSGFYGLLRPFDGVTPYRLEMQSRLAVSGQRDLYAFWGRKLADQLAGETDLVLNLASQEYSRAVEPHLPSSVRFLSCTFGTLQNGSVLAKGTPCKMARGQMVRWLAENNVTRPEDLPNFAQLGYRFSEQHSTKTNMVYIKGEC